MPEKGTFADLIIKYRAGPRVQGWAPATMRKNDKILAEFMRLNGSQPVASLRRGDFLAMRDAMAKTPSEANNWAKVIRGLVDYAVDLEMIEFNPTARVKRLRIPNPDGFRTWREDEIEAFEHYWARGSLPRLVFTLALYTGAARGDLVRLGLANVRGDRIFYRRQKTGAEVDLPVLAPLSEELSQVPPARLTFLETRDGRVRSPVSLATLFGRWCVKAGLGGKDHTGHHLSLHGLRKALGRRLADAGRSEREVMAVLGHTDSKSASVYTKKYDRTRAADAAMGALAPSPTNVTRLRKKEP
jgi:integrase